METYLCTENKEDICKAYPNACLRCGKGKYSEGIPTMSGRYPGLFKEECTDGANISFCRRK